MVSKEDLNVVERFDANGGITLSLYLDVSTPQLRERALERIRDQIGSDGDDDRDDVLNRISEDLDMVELYLSTTVAQSLRHVAIFSCATQLFWRAYSLPGFLEEQIDVGARFSVDPLRRIMAAAQARETEPVLERDLLLQG